MTEPTGRSSAVWQAPQVRRRSVDAEGAVHVEVEVADETGVQGVVRLRLTAGRVLDVRWMPRPGAKPLAGFAAWSQGDVHQTEQGA